MGEEVPILPEEAAGIAIRVDQHHQTMYGTWMDKWKAPMMGLSEEAEVEGTRPAMAMAVVEEVDKTTMPLLQGMIVEPRKTGRVLRHRGLRAVEVVVVPATLKMGKAAEEEAVHEAEAEAEEAVAQGEHQQEKSVRLQHPPEQQQHL